MMVSASDQTVCDSSNDTNNGRDCTVEGCSEGGGSNSDTVVEVALWKAAVKVVAATVTQW